MDYSFRIMPLISDKDRDSLVSYYINSVNSVLKNPNLNLNYPEAEVFKYMAYDRGMKLPVSNIPYGVCEYTKNEDPYLVVLYFNLIQEYLDRDVYKYTGITLTEFLSLPIEEAKVILYSIDIKIDKLNRELERLKSNDKKSVQNRSLHDYIF